MYVQSRLAFSSFFKISEKATAGQEVKPDQFELLGTASSFFIPVKECEMQHMKAGLHQIENFIS